MAAGHAGMGIDDTDYTLVAAHLEAALDAYEVPSTDRRAVLSAVEGLRSDIATA